MCIFIVMFLIYGDLLPPYFLEKLTGSCLELCNYILYLFLNILTSMKRYERTFKGLEQRDWYNARIKT